MNMGMCMPLLIGQSQLQFQNEDETPTYTESLLIVPNKPEFLYLFMVTRLCQSSPE